MLKKLIILCLTSTLLFADGNIINRPDGHGPAGIMADHKHMKNEWMASYRLMNMNMNTYFNGASEISLDTVKSSYTMVPTNMQMNMHMIGAMWGFSDNITIMGMTGYSINSMDMIQMNQSSTMSSQGLNDLKLSALIDLNSSSESNIQTTGQIGISLPVGSIDEKNAAGTHLPYGMQLGSGTYDLILGATRTYFISSTSFGAQINGIIRMGKNKFNYQLGNQVNGNIWAQQLLTDELSGNIRSKISIIGDIKGSDNTISAMAVTMNPEFTTKQGTIVAEVGIGGNFKPKSLNKFRASLEFLVPIYKKSNALSLMNNSSIVFAIQQNL